VNDASFPSFFRSSNGYNVFFPAARQLTRTKKIKNKKIKNKKKPPKMFAIFYFIGIYSNNVKGSSIHRYR